MFDTVSTEIVTIDTVNMDTGSIDTVSINTAQVINFQKYGSQHSAVFYFAFQEAGPVVMETWHHP